MYKKIHTYLTYFSVLSLLTLKHLLYLGITFVCLCLRGLLPVSSGMSYTYYEILKKLHRAIQNKRHGMLISGVVLLHDSTCPDAALILLLVATTCLHTWRTGLLSQCVNSNEELVEGAKMWLSSQAAEFFDRHTKPYSPIWQMPQFQQWLHSAVAYIYAKVI
jgi:hypothetical protein